MRMQFIRNATFVLHTGQHQILVDPMLGPPGSLLPFNFLRGKPRRNPLVPLPATIGLAHLAGVSACLLTHCRYGHSDHLDRTGLRLLAQHQIPVYTPARDQRYLQRRGLHVMPLAVGVRQPFFGGSILPVPAQHGSGWLHRLMGPGVGYVINLPNEPTIYYSGDTVLTSAVRATLAAVQPDVLIIPAGGARLDVGEPILMSEDEVMQCIRLAPGRVVAIHMEALDHCPTTRRRLRQRVEQDGLAQRVLIPDDGAVLQL